MLLADGRGQPGTATDTLVVGPELARVFEQVKRAATGGTLLVQGEPGTGKDIAARLYHASGPRSAGPFVTVSCKAIVGVADRLLFGGKKGVIETIGHFQMARGGTLYLSSIADLDQNAQAALFRLLDVRDTAPHPGEHDVGIVCGGHQLRVAVGDGKLREDLFQRLLQTSVQLPSLRSRRVDLVRLVQLEVAAVGGESNVALGIHPKLLEACALRPWPGNVRELRAAVRQAAAKALGDQRDTVRHEDLLDAAGMPSGASGGAETAVERKSSPGEIDKATVIAAMERANGVLVAAARSLGIHKNALLKLLDDLGMAPESTED
jgi:DNA-binding NtrC family response regulator